tara:strand:- start:6584 stop:7897 length:1314 start_codon:yes stop_codon:yes gene_type:complete
MAKSLGEINTKDIDYYSGQDRDPKTGLPKGLKSQPSSNKDTGVMDESLLGKIRQTLTGASSEINESVSEDIVQHDKLVKAIRNSEASKLTKAKLLSITAKVRGLKSEAKQEKNRSDYGKASVRNKRKFGREGEPAVFDLPFSGGPSDRGQMIDKRRAEHKKKRNVKTKGVREDVIDERLGGKGYKSYTSLTGKKVSGDWPDSDRGAGNKATRRAGGTVKAKSPTYIAHVVNKGKKRNEAYATPRTVGEKKKKQKLAILLSKIDAKKKQQKESVISEAKSYQEFMVDLNKTKERKQAIQDKKKKDNASYAERIKRGIKFYDKRGSGRIKDGKKVYEGAWQVAKAAMSAASKLLATQGGGKFAANSRPGTTIIKPKSKKKLDGKKKPDGKNGDEKDKGKVGIATHVDGKKIAKDIGKGAKTAVKGYTAMFDAPNSESEA